MFLFPGPRELCGAADLISRYKLQQYYDLFCKGPLSSSVTESNYLRNVVGDSEIGKEEPMKLDQLLARIHRRKDSPYDISPFELRVLWGAFEMREVTPLDLNLHAFLTATVVWAICSSLGYANEILFPDQSFLRITNWIAPFYFLPSSCSSHCGTGSAFLRSHCQAHDVVTKVKDNSTVKPKIKRKRKHRRDKITEREDKRRKLHPLASSHQIKNRKGLGY